MPLVRKVCVGDTGLVRYIDGQSRSQVVTIGGSGPGHIGATSPLAAAILGCGVEEEASFEVDGRIRTVMVEAFDAGEAAAA